MKLPNEEFDDSRARALYGKECDDSDGAYFYGPSDYTTLINSLGEVLEQVDDHDYQGDTRVLLRKDGRYGFLNFGWGSCSGCYALQACSNYREIEELIQQMERDIKWFDSLSEAQACIGNDAEREGSYFYHLDEGEKFKKAVLSIAPTEEQKP